MRFISGVIIGIVLTIGVAYVIDAVHTAPGPDQQTAQHLVNWNVVNADMQGLSTSIQDGWARLTGKPRDTKTGT